jgi:hypothetical protein
MYQRELRLGVRAMRGKSFRLHFAPTLASKPPPDQRSAQMLCRGNLAQRAGAVTVIAVALAGCGKANNVEFQAPLVIPLVQSSNAAFSASVKNFSQAQWMGGRVDVYGWYSPDLNDTSAYPLKAVYFQDSQAIGPLAPGAAVVAFNAKPLASFPLQSGSIPATNCVKGFCNGHLHVVLKEQWGVQAKPPYTHVSITWTKSILIAEMTIKDEDP